MSVSSPTRDKAAALPRGADWKLQDAQRHGTDDSGMPTRRQYAGIPVLADGLDVHEAAMDLLLKHAPKSGCVLDVGAGAGAFSQRVLDNGYKGVEAVEVNDKAFRLKNVPNHPLNLDGNWAAQLPRQYDALVAIEIIEHLENPWHFGRQCAAALRPGGVALISTPNIQSSRSRIQFLMKAEFRFFTQRDYEQIGHMSSLTHLQLRQIFTAAGCELLEAGHSRHNGMPRPTSGRKLLNGLFYLATYPLMGGAKQGEVCMFAFRKK